MDGLDVSVEGKVLTFKAATESRAAASVKPGKYTLTIKDKNKKYADVVTTFTLTTKDMPAAYDEENKKLVEAKGFDTDALKAYLGNITSVNVNGKDYATSGRGSVVIINKDGTIKTDADPFKDAVKSWNGIPDYSSFNRLYNSSYIYLQDSRDSGTGRG